MEDGTDQSNAEWRHGSSKNQRRCILTKKIGEIIIGCGRTRQPQEIWFDVREEEHKYQLVSDNSHSSNDQPAKIQNYGKQPRKPAKRLAGILRKSINFNLRKWKAIESSGTSLDERIIRAEEAELCKKRILMGGKCRPLNLSGALHYDEHGILLPEDIFPAEEESETLL